MNKSSMLVSALAIVLLIASRTIAMAQQPAAPSPNAAEAAPVPYTLSMGDMMNTLVQPRHAKLAWPAARKTGRWRLMRWWKSVKFSPASKRRSRGLPGCRWPSWLRRR